MKASPNQGIGNDKNDKDKREIMIFLYLSHFSSCVLADRNLRPFDKGMVAGLLASYCEFGCFLQPSCSKDVEPFCEAHIIII